MATVIVAIIAASVATFGYFITARAKLLEDRRKTYAEALAAVQAYQELPHRIRRRPDSEPKTLGDLGIVISDIQRDLDFYKSLLYLEAYAKVSLKKYKPMAARNEERNVPSGLL